MNVEIKTLLNPLEPKPELFEQRFGRIREMFEKKENLQEILVEMSHLVLLGLKCLTFNDTDEIFWYDKEQGIWKPGAESIIRQICHSVNDRILIRNINEVIDKIRRMTYKERNDFDQPRYLGLKNGVWDFEKKGIINHDQKLYLTKRLNISYNAETKAKKFKKFLKEILHEKDLLLIQQIIGYILSPGYPYHKAFIFTGTGANGKSTLLNVFEVFLGNENISNVLLQNFDKPFIAGQLHGKMANIAADLPSRPVKYTGIFKQLTGEDTIWSDVKFHKTGKKFKNRAKMFFSANIPPAFTGEDTLAVWRRLLLIDFPNRFEGEDADEQLLEKLTTEEELSGIFNFALIGLEYLRNNGGFGGKTDQIRIDYIRKSNTIQGFAEDKLIEDINAEISYNEMWEKYSTYCRKLDQKPKPKQTLTKELVIYQPDIEMRRSGNEHFWLGARWKNDQGDHADQGETGTVIDFF